MASERSNVSAFATWVGGQIKGMRSYVDQQVTTASTSLAGQVTSARTDAATAVQAARNDLTTLIQTSVAGAKAEILGGASSAYDTLLELQAAIQADQSAVSAINTALGKRVRVDAVQTLSGPEQAQGRANLNAVSVDDLGATEVDYVALANTALTS